MTSKDKRKVKRKKTVFPHEISRFLILFDYQKDLGEVDIKEGKN